MVWTGRLVVGSCASVACLGRCCYWQGALCLTWCAPLRTHSLRRWLVCIVVPTATRFTRRCARGRADQGQPPAPGHQLARAAPGLWTRAAVLGSQHAWRASPPLLAVLSASAVFRVKRCMHTPGAGSCELEGNLWCQHYGQEGCCNSHGLCTST